MPWPSSSPTNVVEVVFCRTKCDKMAVIHQDYYFHHNRKYKGGDYWCCAQRGCKVRLISSRVNHETGRMEFSRRNKTIQHQHPPNAPNLIEKEFRRQLVAQFDRVTAGEGGTPQVATAASVRLVYDELRRQAMGRGVPETLIPSFWNVRSTMYRIRRRRELFPIQAVVDPENIRGVQATSAGEGSPRSGFSSAAESPGSSEGTSLANQEQTEPLCLVTWKNETSAAIETSRRNGYQPTSQILFQTLQAPEFPSPIVTNHSQANGPINSYHVLNPIPAVDPNILRYSSHFPPVYFNPSSSNPSGLFHYCAAMHAEYLRSLMAIHLYPPM